MLSFRRRNSQPDNGSVPRTPVDVWDDDDDSRRPSMGVPLSQLIEGYVPSPNNRSIQVQWGAADNGVMVGSAHPAGSGRTLLTHASPPGTPRRGTLCVNDQRVAVTPRMSVALATVHAAEMISASGGDSTASDGSDERLRPGSSASHHHYHHAHSGTANGHQRGSVDETGSVVSASSPTLETSRPKKNGTVKASHITTHSHTLSSSGLANHQSSSAYLSVQPSQTGGSSVSPVTQYLATLSGNSISNTTNAMLVVSAHSHAHPHHHSQHGSQQHPMHHQTLDEAGVLSELGEGEFGDVPPIASQTRRRSTLSLRRRTLSKDSSNSLLQNRHPVVTASAPNEKSKNPVSHKMLKKIKKAYEQVCREFNMGTAVKALQSQPSCSDQEGSMGVHTQQGDGASVIATQALMFQELVSGDHDQLARQCFELHLIFLKIFEMTAEKHQKHVMLAAMQSMASLSPQMVAPVQTTNTVTKDVDADGTKVINGYVVLDELGRGACGKVKLAYDPKNARMVAIKIVRRVDQKVKATGQTQAQAQFQSLQREIAVMKKLRHKNIVSLYEVIDDPEAEKLYLVMQYVDDGPLTKFEGGLCAQVEPQQLLRYARNIVAGLMYLHSHGVVHRDIKLENILVSKEKVAYLADFGVSEVFGTGGSVDGKQGTKRREVVEGQKGTVLYMAPELILHGHTKNGKAVDVWAVGVTLFAALTGQLPFRSQQDIINAKESVVIPSEFGPGWEKLLRGLLAYAPEERLTAMRAHAEVKDLIKAMEQEKKLNIIRDGTGAACNPLGADDDDDVIQIQIGVDDLDTAFTAVTKDQGSLGMTMNRDDPTGLWEYDGSCRSEEDEAPSDVSDFADHSTSYNKQSRRKSDSRHPKRDSEVFVSRRRHDSTSQASSQTPPHPSPLTPPIPNEWHRPSDASSATTHRTSLTTTATTGSTQESASQGARQAAASSATSNAEARPPTSAAAVSTPTLIVAHQCPTSCSGSTDTAGCRTTLELSATCDGSQLAGSPTLAGAHSESILTPLHPSPCSLPSGRKSAAGLPPIPQLQSGHSVQMNASEHQLVTATGSTQLLLPIVSSRHPSSMMGDDDHDTHQPQQQGRMLVVDGPVARTEGEFLASMSFPTTDSAATTTYHLPQRVVATNRRHSVSTVTSTTSIDTTPTTTTRTEPLGMSENAPSTRNANALVPHTPPPSSKKLPSRQVVGDCTESEGEHVGSGSTVMYSPHPPQPASGGAAIEELDHSSNRIRQKERSIASITAQGGDSATVTSLQRTQQPVSPITLKVASWQSELVSLDGEDLDPRNFAGESPCQSTQQRLSSTRAPTRHLTAQQEEDPCGRVNSVSPSSNITQSTGPVLSSNSKAAMTVTGAHQDGRASVTSSTSSNHVARVVPPTPQQQSDALGQERQSSSSGVVTEPVKRQMSESERRKSLSVFRMQAKFESIINETL